ncbi:MAG: phytoene/squalene synthase family protein [Candidatus Diapherotrites archaeon]|nr:phytoene/squalene synthase family protein [Candidatus Diapherotrites archaeon]
MFSSQSSRLLELVSRSFALCIPKLPSPVRAEAENFYLLCRFADSIEDSALPSRKKRIFFSRFGRALKNSDGPAMGEVCLEVLPHVVNENDRELVQNFGEVFAVFGSFDKKSKRIALRWLREMMKGMLKYSKKEIENFLDLDNYCYYVAGTVGLYMTEICEHKFGLKKYIELRARCRDFGLLLQKVNIIRDFAKDFSEGRVYWPSELFEKYGVEKNSALEEKDSEKKKLMLAEMIESTQAHIKNTIEYLEGLPVELRAVAAIPFCMAIPTLMKCSGNGDVFDASKKVKLSRAETMQIISQVERKAGKDSFASDFFTEISGKNQDKPPAC